MLIPLFDYERHRIIMESSFIFKGADYLFFPEGVEYYSLYRTTRKINSFAELEYIAEKFVWLNPEFKLSKMKRFFSVLSDRGSGHIIRTYGNSRVEDMVERVHRVKKKPYCARYRKIIFNPSKMFDRKTKMKIVGQLISAKEKPSEDRISGVIEELWFKKEKITISKVAEVLDTTRHLVRWYFKDDILKSIASANKEIRKENMIAKAIEAIDILTEGGSKLKMRKLKEITSIRDYSLLKQAILNYQKIV